MEAVIFVGIQAVGKSSFYQRRFFRTHIRINLDMLKTRHREQIFLRACIEARQPFVVDNTNPTVEERGQYIHVAKAAGFRIVGYYFQSGAGDALRRNAARPDKERVPARAIYGTLKRLQPPMLDEGFDNLYTVSLTETGEFLVNDWSSGL
jgi:predicted kinase